MNNKLSAAIGNLASSLTVNSGNVPFELVGLETYFRPDDWAWEFLRLRPGYREAYAKALDRQKADPAFRQGAHRSRETHPHRTILNGETDCRIKFGLSTWLDPNVPKLPPLKLGQSWFSPLTEVVEWSEFVDGLGISTGVFGYAEHKRRPAQPPIRVDLRRRSSAVWFAVDCSVPPDGQLKSIAFLADQFAIQLRDAGFTSTAFKAQGHLVLPLKEHDRFDTNDFQRAATPSDDIVNIADLWRLIRVDIMGPVAKQLGECGDALAEQHRQLVEKNLAAPPERERLRLELSSTKAISDGDRPRDGHALKAYALIAQCYLSGIKKPDAIDNAIVYYPPTTTETEEELPKAWDSWIGTRPRRIAGYIEQARRYVSGGYKWLVHAQQP